MNTLPLVVDERGDINLHGRQGAVITLKFSNNDGTPEDVTTKAMTFECGPDVNIALTAGGSSDEKLLTLSNADVKTIYNSSKKEFVVLDSSGTQPTPRWIGTVYLTGWIE